MKSRYRKAFLLIYLLEFILQTSLVQAQNFAIRGRIISSSTGEGLGGAILRDINGKTSTIALGNGSFFIHLKGAMVTLEAAHLGYTTKRITVFTSDSLKSITVELTETAATLEAVTVNTGYERLSPERLTGAYSVVDRRLLEEQVSRGVIERL